jgi:tRNA-dihydrouridine synthase
MSARKLSSGEQNDIPAKPAGGNFWRSIRKPISVLAPMEDVTDSAFRRIVSRCGKPDVFFTEFVNAAGMCSEGRNAVIHRLRFSEEERPIVAQIWGNKPENFRKTAADIQEMGFDGIDINMGCPVKKIVKSGTCSALIENPTLARELFLAAREGAPDIAVSVKTRLGYRTRKTTEWSEFLLELEPDVLIMHGRTAKETYGKPADWNEIGLVVELRNRMNKKTLIIGNGDVKSAEEINSYYNSYGVDGVMVGRGILHNLFLFRGFDNDARADTAFDPRSGVASADFSTLTPSEKLEYLLAHITLYNEIWGVEKNFSVMKKFVKVYVNGFDGAPELRRSLMVAKGFDEMSAIIIKELHKFKS